MTEEMMYVVKQRLGAHEIVRYVLSDLYQFEDDGHYDVIVSSLALHHIVTDQDKKMIYRRILEVLAPGGSFYNADLVLGPDDRIQDIYMKQWKEFMYRSFPREDADEVQVPRYKHENSPAKLIDHLQWLEEAGFRNADAIWKYYNFANYGGKV